MMDSDSGDDGTDELTMCRYC